MSQKIDQIAPDKLLHIFAKSRIIPCLVAAVVLHLVIIAGTSVGYLRAQIPGFKPEAEEKPAEASAKPEPAPAQAAAPAATPEAPAQAAAPADATQPPAAAAKPAAGNGSLSDAELMEQRKNSSVIKRITDVAKPEELPKKPDDLGISLEETSKF